MTKQTLKQLFVAGLIVLTITGSDVLAQKAKKPPQGKNPKWWGTDTPPTKPGKRIYHFGSSTTDQAFGMHSIAQSRGYDSTWSNYMIPGAGLSWLWTHFKIHRKGTTYKKMTEGTWDVLTLQGGGNSAIVHGAGTQEGSGFANLAWKINPQCQIYLFELFVFANKKSPQTYAERYKAIREEYERGADAISQLHSDKKPCLIIPVGTVFAEIEKKVKRGEVPGIKKMTDLNDGTGHLCAPGLFIESVTFFATIYREDPNNCIIDNLYYWREKFKVDKKFAEVVWDVVWDVVQKDPYSGVSLNGPRIMGKSDLGKISLGSKWNWRIPATGGSEKYTWNVSSGNLPQGLNINKDTGIISGVPAVKCAAQFEITVADQDPKRTEVARQLYKLECYMPEAPVIVTKKFYPAVVDGEYWQKIEFDSCYGEPVFSISKGKLPNGISLDGKTGEISGTPSDIGVSEITLTITDKKGRIGSKSFEFEVADSNTKGMTCELYCNTFFKADDYKKYDGLRSEVGYVKDFTLELVYAPDEPFALRFLCDLKIEKAGTYKFFLSSKQSGMISVNGQRLLEKTFTKSEDPVEAEIKLKAGEFPLEVMFWKQGISGKFYTRWKVEWQGPGFERQAIPKSSLLYRPANSAISPGDEEY